MLSKARESFELFKNSKNHEQCLVCFSDLYQGMNLWDFVYHDDVICCECRKKMKPHIWDFKIGDLPVTGIYLYEDHIRTLMLQYKELGDEALSSIFLYPVLKQLKKKYEDYLLVPIPSTEKKTSQRGFHHVIELFRECELPVVDMLEKKEDREQKELNYWQRQDISFTLKKDFEMAGRKILLIDDIVTTGNSIKQADMMLRKQASVINGFVICVHRKLLEEEL